MILLAAFLLSVHVTYQCYCLKDKVDDIPYAESNEETSALGGSGEEKYDENHKVYEEYANGGAEE